MFNLYSFYFFKRKNIKLEVQSILDKHIFNEIILMKLYSNEIILIKIFNEILF